MAKIIPRVNRSVNQIKKVNYYDFNSLFGSVLSPPPAFKSVKIDQIPYFVIRHSLFDIRSLQTL